VLTIEQWQQWGIPMAFLVIGACLVFAGKMASHRFDRRYGAQSGTLSIFGALHAKVKASFHLGDQG
jgi:hypothetical protein